MDSIILLVLILVVVTIPSFLIQRKQRRQMDAIRLVQENLVIGDKVVTSAGLHATVAAITDSTVDLETSEGVISTWEKFAIIRNITQAEAEKQPSLEQSSASQLESTEEDLATKDESNQ